MQEGVADVEEDEGEEVARFAVFETELDARWIQTRQQRLESIRQFQLNAARLNRLSRAAARVRY